jgi:group I intron endonuclease
MVYGYIYETMNRHNGMIYIGKLKGKFNSSYYGSGVVLNLAINKYGKDSFAIRIIDYAETKHRLNKMEKAYISAYRTVYGKESMYNISDGGDGGGGCKYHKINCDCGFCKAQRGEAKKEDNPFFNKHHSEKTRKKMSLAKKIQPSPGMTGKHHSKESNDKNRCAHMGVIPANKGKKGLQIAWNKGLTKETDERVRKNIQNRIENYKKNKTF